MSPSPHIRHCLSYVLEGRQFYRLDCSTSHRQSSTIDRVAPVPQVWATGFSPTPPRLLRDKHSDFNVERRSCSGRRRAVKAANERLQPRNRRLVSDEAGCSSSSVTASRDSTTARDTAELGTTSNSSGNALEKGSAARTVHVFLGYVAKPNPTTAKNGKWRKIVTRCLVYLKPAWRYSPS